MDLFPKETWHRRHLQIIFFGREHCPAIGHGTQTSRALAVLFFMTKKKKKKKKKTDIYIFACVCVCMVGAEPGNCKICQWAGVNVQVAKAVSSPMSPKVLKRKLEQAAAKEADDAKASTRRKRARRKLDLETERL